VPGARMRRRTSWGRRPDRTAATLRGSRAASGRCGGHGTLRFGSHRLRT